MTWGSEWGILWGEGIAAGAGDTPVTSGSWTYEAFYRFPPGRNLTNSVQSLARISVSGSASGSSTLAGIVPAINCVAISGSNSIVLYSSPSYGTSSVNIFTLQLTGVNVFDGNQWNISFGRFRSDDPTDYLPEGVSKSNTSSSYFLRAARAQRDKIIEKFVTSSFYQETDIAGARNMWSATFSGSVTSGGPIFDHWKSKFG